MLSNQIESKTETLLNQALISNSQSEIENSLQIYFNLGILTKTIEKLISIKVFQIEEETKNSLEYYKFGLNIGNENHLSSQEQFLYFLRKIVSVIEKETLEIVYLQIVLEKKNFMIQQEITIGYNSSNLVEIFLSKVCKALNDWSSLLCQLNKFNLKEIIVSNYPNIVLMFDNMFEKFSQKYFHGYRQKTIFLNLNSSVMSSFQIIKDSFSSRSLMKMKQAVSNIIVSGNTYSLPSLADVQKMISVLYEEYKSSGVAETTEIMIGKNIGEVLIFIKEKIILMAASGPDLRLILYGCNLDQQKNITLCTFLQEIHRSFISMIPKLQVIL